MLFLDSLLLPGAALVRGMGSVMVRRRRPWRRHRARCKGRRQCYCQRPPLFRVSGGSGRMWHQGHQGQMCRLSDRWDGRMCFERMCNGRNTSWDSHSLQWHPHSRQSIQSQTCGFLQTLVFRKCLHRIDNCVRRTVFHQNFGR